MTEEHFLTIPEAAVRLRVSRNAAYQAARRYRHTGGREGLPNLAIGGSYRVPIAALDRMADLGLPPIDAVDSAPNQPEMAGTDLLGALYAPSSSPISRAPMSRGGR